MGNALPSKVLKLLCVTMIEMIYVAFHHVVLPVVADAIDCLRTYLAFDSR